MVHAILVIPPFLKYSAGPLLGPSLLKSAALRAGHSCSVLDMNAVVLQSMQNWMSEGRVRSSIFVGDHDKPEATEKNASLLNQMESDFLLQNRVGGVKLLSLEKERLLKGFLGHDAVQTGAADLAYSTWFGSLVATELKDQQDDHSTPHLVGLSLLHAGQLLPAVAISMLARQLWPEALIVWGGPHMSGLGKEALSHDLHHRHYGADIYVVGHAEQTFVQILNSLQSGIGKSSFLSGSRVLQGSSGCASTSALPPTFENLHLYGPPPITLPAQSTLGCAYGRCAFCTYPAIEPQPVKLPLDIAVGSVVDKAVSLGPGVSVAIKDSLATALRLHSIAECVKGRVAWSACTKLSRKLDIHALTNLGQNGLATLEVGLESLLPETQRRIHKVQPQALYRDFVSAVAKVGDISLVVNYMTGFPWEDVEESEAMKIHAKEILHGQLGDHGKLEHNFFELERLSPMAQRPEQYGIDRKRLNTWPWASVLDIEESQ